MGPENDSVACLDFLEACYAWHLSDSHWLERVLGSAVRVWGKPRWACGFFYDAADITRFKFNNLLFLDTPAPAHDQVVEVLSNVPPPFVANTYRSLAVGFGRPVAGDFDNIMLSTGLVQAGTLDIFGINGLDPSGLGCFIGIGAERTVLSSGEILTFQRLAAHLSSAYRCRRRLQILEGSPLGSAEAVLAPDGRFLEVNGPAETIQARAAIQHAAKSIEEVRRQRDGRASTRVWRPRVQARWTLVDVFEQDGERYMIARENHASTPGLSALTEREQQVVAGIAVGKTSKEIAYELGISDATVRVLTGRACNRLGVRGRKDLFELGCVAALRGATP